ncbi:holo-[acyl-carrier-protein] synthase [candidate division KSB1 bacterium]|nr:holo-[acyl-carrier-protein] synthase [candidate division KSB1 bacterium]
MIIGIGVDITEVDRLRQSVHRYGDRFLNKIFRKEELSSCRSFGMFEENLAMLFAAKEAVVKALGTGIRDGILWKDIEITLNDSGDAKMHFSGNCEYAIRDLGANMHWISMSSTSRHAVAMVVLESTLIKKKDWSED